MHDYIPRELESLVRRRLGNSPAVAILGPRQCGKSTLAKRILQGVENSLYLDLERPSDRNKLFDAEAFFGHNSQRLICLDEIQRVPDLFPVLRSVIDHNDRDGQFLILGSASRDLLKQSSETLAGRIAYIELTPLNVTETSGDTEAATPSTINRLWLRGGFPRSFLAATDTDSFEWRLDFIRTYLERDIPQLGIGIAPGNLERLWNMCAHVHGQLLNCSKLGDSMGLSNHTVRSYIDLLSSTFTMRILAPFAVNLKKRLVKSPRIYIRDSGVLHCLLGIETGNDLFGHPVYGGSWESLVLETILGRLKPGTQTGFFRTSGGAEIDLVLERGGQRLAIECKASSSPKVTRGFWSALDDLDITKALVVGPVDASYSMTNKVTVTHLAGLTSEPWLQPFIQ